jgi:hypothetical protein
VFEINEDDFQNYKSKLDLTNFPKQWSARFAETTPDNREQWYRERFQCLVDPLFLSGFVEAKKSGDSHLPPSFVPIMGMDFQRDPHEVLFSQFVQKKPGSGKVFSDLDQLSKKFMILWPRGLFKTSAIIVDIIQTILNYPNIRICFLTGGDVLAKRQLKRIKKFFESPSDRFKTLFPDFCTKSVLDKKKNGQYVDVVCKLGTAHEFTVPCRTSEIFAEPTFAISTAKSVKAGSHFDIIYIDDLVNEQNYRSPKALEKCYQDYLDICPLLEPTGFMVVTGTRYSFGDTYERIQERAREEEKKIGRTIWRFSIRNCWTIGCTCGHADSFHDYRVNMSEPPCLKAGCSCKGFSTTGAKGVLFPITRTLDGRSIGHTLEFLEGEKLRLGDEFFANQYENQPIATGSQTFTEPLIDQQTLLHINQIPDYSASDTIVVGDLAYVGQEGRDYSVLYAARVHQGQLFAFDCDFGNWDSGAVAQHTVDFLFRHRPSMMFYEKFLGHEAYNSVIAAHALTRGLEKVPLQWMQASNTTNAKLIRIGSIKGVLAQRRLWLFGGMRGYDILRNQLLKWPKLGRHDDFADCLGLLCNAPTGYQTVLPPAVETATDWFRKLAARRPEEDTYQDGGCGTGIVC